ncbi:MAG: gliding motility-associated ABC transporter ATP-binding subunit GldA [Bacteroidetes bacterium]|nr:gliding motility-associated ABC transporter ATP-binding subunit GldA [Bacteroidota bacterium]
MSIKVNNISKLYGAQKALNNVSFEVSSGEIVGFLGPNGAGKSTMMKILTCFIPPTNGTAFVCGHDIAEQSIEVRKCVGYLAEHNPLYLDMYVKEYLEFIAGLHPDKIARTDIAARVKKMIEITGLQVEQKKKIGALSKGYRQRVGLAEALIHDPQVLILDEPTTGLDPNQLAEIRSLIKEVGREKTVMLSTHIMQEVEAICDRVIIINKGEIVADDKTENIQKTKGNKQIITVEFDKETSADSLKTVPGITSAKNIREQTWQLIADSEKDVRPEIFQYAVQNNLSVLTLQKEEQRLEDVFKELTT